MAESTLNGHWQTTVPAEVRHALGLEAGTRLMWEIAPDGVIVVRPSMSSSSGPQEGSEAHSAEIAGTFSGHEPDTSGAVVSTMRGDVSTGGGAWGVDFLFTSSVQRMLAAALMRPGYEYTLEEMLTIAGTGRGNTQRQLERLIGAGVLREGRRRGRQRCIAANHDYFLYPELLSIARRTFGLSVLLSDALQPFSDDIDEALVLARNGGRVDGRQRLELVVIGAIPEAKLNHITHVIERNHGLSVRLRAFTAAAWQEIGALQAFAALPAMSVTKLRLTREPRQPSGKCTHLGTPEPPETTRIRARPGRTSVPTVLAELGRGTQTRGGEEA